MKDNRTKLEKIQDATGKAMYILAGASLLVLIIVNIVRNF